MFLTKEAVRLVLDGFAVGVACDGCPPLPDLSSGTRPPGGALLRVPGLLQRPEPRRGAVDRGRRGAGHHPDVELDRRRRRHDLQLLSPGAAGVRRRFESDAAGNPLGRWSGSGMKSCVVRGSGMNALRRVSVAFATLLLVVSGLSATSPTAALAASDPPADIVTGPLSISSVDAFALDSAHGHLLMGSWEPRWLAGRRPRWDAGHHPADQRHSD